MHFCLQVIAERWKISTTYRDLFDALSERTINMICRDAESWRPDTTTASDTGTFSHADDPFLDQMGFLDLQNMQIPAQSEWLLQEFVQGVRGSEFGTYDNIDIDFSNDLYMTSDANPNQTGT